MWVSRSTGRSVVTCTEGVVATSQPLAAQVGVSILQNGGNAIDAAIAVAAALNVVEPMSTGIGGDVFALVALEGNANRVTALNASGRSGCGMTLEALQELDIQEIPLVGGIPITVPGALDGWCQLLRRYGTMDLKDVLKPAINYAEEGFPVSEIIAYYWKLASSKLAATPEAASTYLDNGRTPLFGQVFKQPYLARSLTLIANNGPEVFYEGVIADQIVSAVKRHGGFIEKEDLAAHLGRSIWEEPISTNYRGHQIFECGPNGQGIAALMGLNILENFSLTEWGRFEHLHHQIEAVKLSYADLHRFIADPSVVPVPTQELLAKDYTTIRSNLISSEKAISTPRHGLPYLGEDTVYLAVVDKYRNCVSFINSLFYGFGSGIVAGETGIVLQNRGALFSLDPSHPNVVAPNKRPFHTIIPGIMAKDGEIELVFGIMGGDHQAQAHLQVMSNVIDFHLNVQQAVEVPRFNYSYSQGITTLEDGFPQEVHSELRAIGHKLEVLDHRTFGGGQLIAIDHNKQVLLAGSDPRKDGCAVGY